MPACHVASLVGTSRRIPTRHASAHRHPVPATAVATSRHAPTSGPHVPATGRLPFRTLVVAPAAAPRTNAPTGPHVVVRLAIVGPRSFVTYGATVSKVDRPDVSATRMGAFTPADRTPTSTHTWREVTPELPLLRRRAWSLSWELLVVQPEP